MKEMIIELAQKYGFESILQRVQGLTNAPTIRIGFIGEFSAGKSSLINSILDIHLPTNIAPTTKAICLIEPTVGLENNLYFKEDGGIRQPIAFGEFRNILRGEGNSQAAVVQVPPCEVLPSGCVFVDTPGIHTATGTEAELTKAYLGMLDAAVVCINITNGVINKDLQDFICDNELKHLQKHMVFALTWSDRKSPEECEIVRSSIVRQLEKTVQDGKMEMTNIDKKVFTISAQESGNAAKLYAILKDAVLEDLPALHEQRKNRILSEIGKDLQNLMENRLKTMEFDSSQIDSELENTQREVKALNAQLRKREEQMDALQESVVGKVRSILSSHIGAICSVDSSEERAPLIEAMNAEVQTSLQSEAKRYFNFTDLVTEGLGDIGTEIEAKMKSIDAFKNLSVTIATALATAWIIPGGGLAGNIGQGVAGAAAQGAAKSAAGAVAKGAAGAVATAGASGAFAQVLGGIGATLKAINPLEHIGTLFANSAKKNAIEAMLNEKSAGIAAAFITSLETPFQLEILQPLQDQQEEKRKQLSDLQDKGMQEFDNFRKGRGILEQEISQLKITLQF